MIILLSIRISPQSIFHSMLVDDSYTSSRTIAFFGYFLLSFLGVLPFLFSAIILNKKYFPVFNFGYQGLGLYGSAGKLNYLT